MLRGIVTFAILFGLSDLVKSDETKAILVLIAKHVVKPTVKAGDDINYTMLVRHDGKSKLDAVEVVITIDLPVFVRFARSPSLPGNNTLYSSRLYSNNYAEFTFQSLPVHSQGQFNFSAIITDTTLSSGLHYASTSIKVSHKTRLIGDQITSLPFQFSDVSRVPFLVAGCLQPLGMGLGTIKFFQLSASTTQVNLKPYKARHNGVDDAWCAGVGDNEPYIQVFMSKTSRITGISTWGRKEKALWVKEYSVEFSLDGEKWNSYGESGISKLFTGNTDRHSQIQHWLMEPIIANFIRIRPTRWSVGVCLRFELYGCIIGAEDNCIHPLGMENGKIPLSSISSIISPTNLNFSRLNKEVEDFPHGWLSDSKESEDWLEIDLGSIYQLTAIALQGAYSYIDTGYVTKFKVRYSNDTNTWTKIINKNNGQEESYLGQQGTALPDMIYLDSNITARHMRIIPTERQDRYIMRLELYGCLRDQHALVQDVDVPMSRRIVLFDQNNNTIFVCVYSNDREKSVCKRSSNGNLWQSVNPNIIAILHQARVSRRLFAVDRNHNKAFSDDGGDIWYTISQTEWGLQTIGTDVINATHVENILPSKKPDEKHTWRATNGKEWGVSGNGIHLKHSDAEDWVLSATWKCCGL